MHKSLPEFHELIPEMQIWMTLDGMNRFNYPVDHMDSGEMEAHATVLLDGSLCDVRVSMKLTDTLTCKWKVAGIDVSAQNRRRQK